MRDPHPQERPPGVKTKHSKKKTFTLDSDDEDDIPLVVRSLKPPPNKQGKKRKAPSEDPDEEPFQTMEIPPEVTPAVGKPAKRPKKLKPSEAASEKYAKENIPESRRKQSQKPKEVPVQVTPSSPPPGVLGTQDADPDSPAKNGTKQKAKRERKALVNQDNETHEEEPAQQ